MFKLPYAFFRKKFSVIFLLTNVIGIMYVLFTDDTETNFSRSTSPEYDHSNLYRNTWKPTHKITYNYSGPPLKKILLYIEESWLYQGQEPFIYSGCKVNTCFATNDSNLFPPLELDAVVMKYSIKPRQMLPKIRSRHTRYVFYEREAQVRSHLWGNVSHFNGMFNWTIMFRQDADIIDSYGSIFKKTDKNIITRFDYNKPDTNYAASKTKQVAWMVSNCKTQSFREQYVNELKKYITVDVYGKCGNHECPKSNKKACERILENNYKFYLAFENSLCTGYITEKFFYTLRINIIPIVYGRGPYEKVAPPNSYIDVMDYKGPKELADYLHYLDKNHDKYNEYFKWKPDHYFVGIEYRIQLLMCKLCEKLHTDQEEKIYHDLDSWFFKDQCIKENNINEIIKKWWHVY